MTEEIHAEQRVIPFEIESLADDTMFINETNITQAGQNGLAATLVKVRYEDGLEVSRQTVNALETEKHDPSLDLAYRIAAIFERPIEDIFENPHA